MKTESEVAIVQVSFDVDQISAYLHWGIFDGEGNKRSDMYPPFGRHAGALHLREGDSIGIEVTAYGDADSGSLVTINILDAMFYSVPHGNGTLHSAPSPFSAVRATMPIGQWAPAEACETIKVHGKRYRTVVQRSLTPLKVVEQDGRWKFSLILTVAIEREIRKGKARRDIRVFVFDPEAEVGSGTEPRPRHDERDGIGGRE